jgi:hypothetical protein
VRIAHRFIGGKRASNSVSPVGTAGEKCGSSVPKGLRGSAIIIPSTEDAGLLSEIPSGTRVSERFKYH